MNIDMNLQAHTVGTNSGTFYRPDLQLMHTGLYTEGMYNE